ncbi:FKBP-type peptidyl-prolyl cis-trans isomerase [Thiohalorhabdus sp.]|uniref:FKBP-type peptidyl-prolyl cis-trans isomerase n=1 Tax=Thiohalorhabdus sp. TaxID=3094134 RepID=UPI002FC2B944
MPDKRVQKDKVVQISYAILDQDGSVLEHLEVPIAYVHGHDSGLFEQVEAALEGRSFGDRVSVTLGPEEAFGQRDPGLVQIDDLANVPPQYQELGKEIDFQNDKGDTKTFRVIDISEGKLTVDGNHPLAGKTLTFVVDVAGVRDATPEEIRDGSAADPPQIH